jgi:hypothetical protein
MATKCHICLRNIKAKHTTAMAVIHHKLYTVHKACIDKLPNYKPKKFGIWELIRGDKS